MFDPFAQTQDIPLTDDEIREQFAEIKSTGSLAVLLGVAHKRLVWHLWKRDPEERYRTFRIRKRSGGFREIAAPEGGLAILQRKLAQVLRAVYQPGSSVQGFVRGRSIVTNATVHIGRRFVLNVDLQDFFPSIHFGRVRGLFMSWPYERNNDVATSMAQLCFAGRKGLPQGAPTSPVVANMICAAMDARLARLAQRRTCSYTRYSDDMTFSTTKHRFPPTLARREGGVTELGSEIREIIEQCGFQVNTDKVRLQTRYDRQEVTGLVTNERINVRRKFVRQIRAILHAWEKFGRNNTEKVLRDKDTKHRRDGATPLDLYEVVRGKLEFLGMVRGRHDRLFTALVHRARKLDADFGTMKTREDAVLVIQRDPDAHIRDGIETLGSAFLLEGVGLVTAAHVVCHDKKVLSGLQVLREHAPNDPSKLEVIFCDPALDIAVCRIPIPRLPSLKAGNPSRVRRGDSLTILGFPHWKPGQQIRETPAVVVGKARRFNADRIDVEVLIQAGNSGGPALNADGEVIGIAVTGAEDGDHPNAILPITLIRERAAQLGHDLATECLYVETQPKAAKPAAYVEPAPLPAAKVVKKVRSRK